MAKLAAYRTHLYLSLYLLGIQVAKSFLLQVNDHSKATGSQRVLADGR
jgi:hypothetical protein